MAITSRGFDYVKDVSSSHEESAGDFSRLANEEKQRVTGSSRKAIRSFFRSLFGKRRKNKAKVNNIQVNNTQVNNTTEIDTYSSSHVSSYENTEIVSGPWTEMSSELAENMQTNLEEYLSNREGVISENQSRELFLQEGGWTSIKQSSIRNCFWVTFVAGLIKNPMMLSLMQSSTKVSSGGMTTSFCIPLGEPGGEWVSVDSVRNGSGIRGPLGWNRFEAATVKYLMYKSGKITKEELSNPNISLDYSIMNGGIARYSAEMLLGEGENVESFVFGRGKTAKSKKHYKNQVFSYFSTLDMVEDIVTLSTPKGSDKRKFKVGGQKFAYGHAYVLDMELTLSTFSGSPRQVVVRNPWNTADPIYVKWKDFTDVFPYTSGIQFLGHTAFNSSSQAKTIANNGNVIINDGGTHRILGQDGNMRNYS